MVLLIGWVMMLLARQGSSLAPCQLNLPSHSITWNQNSAPHISFNSTVEHWEGTVEMQSGDLLTVTLRGWELNSLYGDHHDGHNTTIPDQAQNTSETVTESLDRNTTEANEWIETSVQPSEAGASEEPSEARASKEPSEAGTSVQPSEEGASVRPSEAGASEPPHITLPQAYLTPRNQGCDMSDSVQVDVQVSSIVPDIVLVISDKDMGDGENHLILVTGMTECIQIKVMVKSENCGEEIDCSRQGACYTNATMEGYECQCCPGYMGPHCEEKDACYPSPCLNDGICVDISQGHQGSSFQCLCPYGFRGKVCELSGDPCVSGPCLNGGACAQTNETAMQFKCTCANGYAGTLCQQQIDPCASSPCKHGICVSQNRTDSFNCFCRPGYTGTLCDMEYNECESSPCHHGGTCEDIVNGFTCQCTPGYSGTACQTKVDLCAMQPCGKERRCLDRGDSYICQCPSGFTGPDCLIPTRAMCNGNPCKNGGTCWTALDSYYCACRPGFTGNSCQEELVVEVVGGDGLEESPPPPPQPTIHLHSVALAAFMVIGAMCIVVVIVVIIHCRLHYAYKKWYRENSNILFPQSPITLENKIFKKAETTRQQQHQQTSSSCILDHCDVFFPLDLSDSQSSLLIQ